MVPTVQKPLHTHSGTPCRLFFVPLLKNNQPQKKPQTWKTEFKKHKSNLEETEFLQGKQNFK